MCAHAVMIYTIKVHCVRDHFRNSCPIHTLHALSRDTYMYMYMHRTRPPTDSLLWPTNTFNVHKLVTATAPSQMTVATPPHRVVFTEQQPLAQSGQKSPWKWVFKNKQILEA